jgi:hypothetical protein
MRKIFLIGLTAGILVACGKKKQDYNAEEVQVTFTNSTSIDMYDLEIGQKKIGKLSHGGSSSSQSYPRLVTKEGNVLYSIIFTKNPVEDPSKVQYESGGSGFHCQDHANDEKRKGNYHVEIYEEVVKGYTEYKLRLK